MSLSLNGNNVLLAISINRNIHLVDLNLPYSLSRSSQMVLQGVGGNPQENIDQFVVANKRQQGLLIALRSC